MKHSAIIVRETNRELDFKRFSGVKEQEIH